MNNIKCNISKSLEQLEADRIIIKGVKKDMDRLSKEKHKIRNDPYFKVAICMIVLGLLLIIKSFGG